MIISEDEYMAIKRKAEALDWLENNYDNIFTIDAHYAGETEDFIKEWSILWCIDKEDVHAPTLLAAIEAARKDSK